MGFCSSRATRPVRRTVPRVAVISPAAWRSRVDLPAPFRPISATRSPGATVSETSRRIAGPARSSCQTCSKASAGTGAALAARRRARHPPGAATSVRIRLGRRGSRPARRSAPRARLTPGTGAWPNVQQPLPRGLEGGGHAARPLQELGGRRVADDAATGEGDDAVGRAQAALEAMLGEHDGRIGVLVDPAQQPDELVPGDRVQLRGRLVEHDHPRAPRQRRAEGHALQLAAGELSGGAIKSWSMASASAASSTPRATSAGERPRFSSPKASSARTVPVTTWVSGS